MTDDLEKKAEQIRERVERARDDAVVPRMRVHGFWPKGQGLPEDPVDEAAERRRLETEKAALVAQLAPAENVDAALAKERARRILESRQKRDARNVARAESMRVRRLAWVKERVARIVHAGVGVSGALQEVTSNEAELLKRGLPILHTANDVAAAIGVALPRLRWLTYHRRTATLVHYHRFTLPKKSGGQRQISAPKPALKQAQQWIFTTVLQGIADAAHLHPAAHGFIATKNVVGNALPHVGRAVVVNLDLRNFFPGITFVRVRGLFRGLGYSGAVATIFALLCTEPPRIAVGVDGQRVFVAVGERHLPQGACTSPALTNLLCRRLDARLQGLANAIGFAYTRYADDLTFSSSTTTDVSTLLFRVRRVVFDEGLTVNEEKTRVMRRGRRQEVTGVIVNDRPSVAREEVRRLRAVLHQAGRDGFAAARRAGADGVLQDVAHFVAQVRGRIAWVQLVDRAKGDALRAAFDAIVGVHINDGVKTTTA